MSKMKCPICHGIGKITENTDEYEFITREANTNRCLVCAGTGEIAPRKKLPDGRAVYEVAKDNAAEGKSDPINQVKKSHHKEKQLISTLGTTLRISHAVMPVTMIVVGEFTLQHKLLIESIINHKEN